MTAAAQRLTTYSPGGGCACKLPQALLEQVLDEVDAGVPAGINADLLVGLSARDDAAVYAVDAKRAWIVTTDFITPVVDDPFEWGRIAATNAFSDVYAMGGRPLLALNLLAWPEGLDRGMLKDVLSGGARAVADAGALLVGGHSIVDPVPKFGLVAIGEVERSRLLTKGGGSAGDHLVLTKPLGVGIVATAVKQGKAPNAAVAAAVASMTRLNAGAARVATDNKLRGGTDVTGYGLIGHLHEMARAAGLSTVVDPAAVPQIPGVLELIGGGSAPTGTRRTLANALQQGWFEPGKLDEAGQLLLADAQTSGGLLLAVPPVCLQAVLAELRAAGELAVADIGQLDERGRSGDIRVMGSER